MNSDFIFPQQGDIGFIHDQDIISNLILLGQKVVHPQSPSEASHVLICLSGDVWLHAEPPQVSLVSGREIFDPRKNNWFILRNKLSDIKQHTSEEESMTQKWFDAAMDFIGHKYSINSLFGLSVKGRAVFCSQLVAEMYKKVGYTLNLGSSQSIFPSDLAKLRNEIGWLDVTNSYKLLLGGNLYENTQKYSQDNIKMMRKLAILNIEARIDSVRANLLSIKNSILYYDLGSGLL